MPKFKVTYSEISYFEGVVEADNKQQARNLFYDNAWLVEPREIDTDFTGDYDLEEIED